MNKWLKTPDYISTKVVLLIFIVWRVCDFLIVYLASHILPYLGNFPYRDLLDKYYIPHVFSSFANFDGVHYLTIAKEGYYSFNQAYFPLYSMLIRGVELLIRDNFIVSALLISNTAFFIGLLFFVKYLRQLNFSENKIFWTLLFLIIFPTSFFFGAIYTTSLFFLLFLVFSYYLGKNNILLSTISGVLSGLTRIDAVVLSISSICAALAKKRIKPVMILPLISPIIGILIYCAYLFISKGDALYFLHSLPAFGVNRSTSVILLPQVIFRYIKIFLTSDFNFQLFVAYLEFIVFVMALLTILYFLRNVWRNKKETYYTARLGAGIFSLGVLVMPTLTGTFTSIPRYALYSIAMFIVLGSLNNKLIKITLIISFIILHVLLLSLFSQGYFIS